MNDEIKEILEYISDRIIPNDKWNKVKDYITNLQEENERLKDWKEDLLKENIELENIRKEAIEYIKVGKTFDNEYTMEVVKYLQNNLLNILKGEGNDN